jgi:transposase InsO family protein
MTYQFIERQRGQHAVRTLCQLLKVAPSGYYAWRGRGPSPRAQANAALVAAMREIHAEVHQTYGSPRLHAALRARGHACNRKRVARLMRRHGIRARQPRRCTRTTRTDARLPVAPNLLQRDFSATGPNHKWAADITYLDTLEGWLYLAVILDLFSRRVVGWAMAPRPNTDLTLAALRMALLHRQPPPGQTLHHADQGVQFAARPYQALLAAHGIQPSMSRTGNCYDNAPVESFFGSLKSELIHPSRSLTRAQARAEVFAYIETFYNPVRLHSALGFLSPAHFEQAMCPAPAD